MELAQARVITDLIQRNHLRDVLELGFRHGVSTCYLADAVRDVRGHVTTIDLEAVLHERPNIDDLLNRLGLAEYVTYYVEPTSYTWRLMKMLEADATPRYDLCYIDGAHDWFVDGFAFFLVDRLLRPGGWIVFDDLDWTFASSPALGHTQRVRDMPDEEKLTPQVRRVFELLVVTHPGYVEFRVERGWGFARKSTGSAEQPPARRSPKLSMRIADEAVRRIREPRSRRT